MTNLEYLLGTHIFYVHTSCIHLKHLLCVRVQAKGKSKNKAVGKGGAAAASNSAEAPEQAEVLFTVLLYTARCGRTLMSLAINPRRDACLLLLKQAFRHCLPTFMSRCP
jgi:hypothetical protein